MNLLNGQNGRRLVEDENLGPAVKRLQNFDALLHADGNVLDLNLGVDLKSVLLRQVRYLPVRLTVVDGEPSSRLDAEDDVLRHREVLDELEVLVNHSDSKLDGLAGTVDDLPVAVHVNLAFIRLVQTEQNAHERRFARSVLPEQRVDLSFAQLQADVVVRYDSREPFGDPSQFDDGYRLFHGESAPLSE